MGEVEALHFDCIGCQARSERAKETRPEEQAMTILFLYERGELVDARKDLCFEHRRWLEAALRDAT